MAIKVSSYQYCSLVYLLIVIAMMVNNYSAEAKGRSTAGLSPKAAKTLTKSLDQSDQEVQHELELRPTNESVWLACSRRYNESIDSLTDSLIYLNQTRNPPTNESAYIENWVKEAEKNETDCLAQPTFDARNNSGPNHSSAVKFRTAFSFVSSSLLDVAIGLSILLAFNVYY